MWVLVRPSEVLGDLPAGCLDDHPVVVFGELHGEGPGGLIACEVLGEHPGVGLDAGVRFGEVLGDRPCEGLGAGVHLG